MKYSVFVDADGVIADFRAGIESYGFKLDPSLNRSSHLLPGSGSAKKREMYEAVKGTTFYAHLPLENGAISLFKAVLEVDPEPIILTAAPKFGATEDDYFLNPYWLGAAYHKRNWVETVLLPAVEGHNARRIRIKDEYFICTTSARKHEFMHRKHSEKQILIDDRTDNIDAWSAAGGIGILHTTAEESIRMLKEIVNG